MNVCGVPVYIPSTNMNAGDPSTSTEHLTVEPLLPSCKLWTVRLTGLSVFPVAGELSPGSLLKKSAVVGVVTVPLTITISQNSERVKLSLCLQVKVTSPPTGTTYPCGIREPSAQSFATTCTGKVRR